MCLCWFGNKIFLFLFLFGIESTTLKKTIYKVKRTTILVLPPADNPHIINLISLQLVVLHSEMIDVR